LHRHYQNIATSEIFFKMKSLTKRCFSTETFNSYSCDVVQFLRNWFLSSSAFLEKNLRMREKLILAIFSAECVHDIAALNVDILVW